MKKVREFRWRAKECRQLGARASTSELRAHYEEMAEVWDKLAHERLTFFVDRCEADNDDGDLLAARG
jgi:hypothetical protein